MVRDEASVLRAAGLAGPERGAPPTRDGPEERVLALLAQERRSAPRRRGAERPPTLFASAEPGGPSEARGRRAAPGNDAPDREFDLDTLRQATGLAVPELLELLGGLELKGRVARLPGQRYMLRRS
jgi:predicted Rossmann fold nucleotide-binding protein DprA/Smf involved in DNA uptake